MTLFDPQLPQTNTHWIPTRIILINYWLYHSQVFHFKEGRLFLTGHNGSGKSTALTAAITLLLDGDSSPSRMDPFGGTRRSVRYYLLGDADAGFQHDSRRAYLALEFLTPEGSFCTIGLCLQASMTSKDITKWGFLVPGRVQHPQGFSLINPTGSALNRKELEDKVRGLGGTVAQNTDEYAKLVRQKVFNHAKPEDFRDLLNLIITVRGSKLGKDVKPSRLEELLRQALPPLSKGVLEQLSEGIERMERHVEKVDMLQRQTAASARILQSHLAWGQAAGHATQRRVLDLQTLWQAGLLQLERSKAEQEELQMQLDGLGPEGQRLNQELDTLAIEIDTLERQLRDSGGTLANLEQDLEKSRRELEKNRSARRQQHERLEKLRIKILNLQQQTIGLEEEQQSIHLKLQALPWWASEGPNARGQGLSDAQTALRCFEKENTLLQQHQANLERQTQHTTEAQKELADATSRLEEVLRSTAHSLLQHTQHFDFSASDLQQYLEHLEQQVEVREAFVHLQNTVDRTLAEAEHLHLEHHHRTHILQQEHTDLLIQQKHLMDQTEVHPDVPANRNNVLQVLAEAGIWARAFYQCLEPKVGTETRGLEGALASAGILTALCTPDPEGALEVLQAHQLTDVFLMKTAPVLRNLTDFFEVMDDQEGCVLDILSSIGMDHETLTHVRTDGVWKNQVMVGNSLLPTLTFIGVTAREQARAQQLKNLEVSLVLSTERLKNATLNLQQTQNQLALLKEARSQLREAPEEMRHRNQAQKQRDRARTELDIKTHDFEEALQRLHLTQAHAQTVTAQLHEAFLLLGFQEKDMNQAGLDLAVREHQEATKAHQKWEANQEQLSRCHLEWEERQQDLLSHQEASLQLEEEQGQLENLRNTLTQQVQRLREQSTPDVTQWRTQLNRSKQRRAELHQTQQQLNQRTVEVKTRLHLLKHQHPELEKAFDAKQQDLEQALQNLEDWKQMFHLEPETLPDLPDLPLQALEAVKEQAAAHARDIFENQKHHLEAPENFLPRYTPQGPMFTHEGQKTTTWEMMELMKSALEQAQSLLSEEEAQVFRDELFTALLEELHLRIREARNWVQGVKDTLKGLRFNGERLDLDFHLVEKTGLALKMDDKTHPMHQPDSWKQDLRLEIRQKIHQIQSTDSQQESFQQTLERFLDYRNWYGFRFFSFIEGSGAERKREITDRTFQQRSGGERSAVLYTFLFAALAARFKTLGREVPRLIGMDEAFAGMDTTNIAALYQILVDLEFSFMATSERRVDLSPALPAACTYQLFRASSSTGDGVDSVCYIWNGRQSKDWRPVD